MQFPESYKHKIILLKDDTDLKKENNPKINIITYSKVNNKTTSFHILLILL